MRNDEFDTVRIYDWGHGMPLYLKHRQIKLPLDEDKGDSVEFYDGEKYVRFSGINDEFGGNFRVDAVKGILYIRGWFLSYFRKNKFRFTYRYGSDQEGQLVPEDINECCILMVHPAGCASRVGTTLRRRPCPALKRTGVSGLRANVRRGRSLASAGAPLPSASLSLRGEGRGEGRVSPQSVIRTELTRSTSSS